MLLDQGVSVIIRVRPFNNRELRSFRKAFDVTADSLHSLNSPQQLFTFDAVLNETATNSDAYQKMDSIVTGSMEGVNGTIFAYISFNLIQYIVMDKLHLERHIQCLGLNRSQVLYLLINSGITPLALAQIFDHIRNCPEREFMLSVSCKNLTLF
jgi:hypothetical protein